MRHTASSVLVVLTAVLVVGSCKQMRADSNPTGQPAESAEASSSESTRSDPTTTDQPTDDASGEVSAETADEPEPITEPGGRFSTTVPPGWSTDTDEGEISLTAPDEDLRVHLLAVDNGDLAEAVETAWQRAAPDRTLTVKKRLDAPTDEGVEKQIVVDYEMGEDGQYAQAIAQRHDETSYIILIDGKRSTIEERSEELQRVGTDFEIAAIDEDRLEGETARRLDEEQIRTLETFIHNGLDQFGVPGAAVGIVQDGEMRWAKGFGTRRKGEGGAVDDETMMLVGSATATMTTMLMGAAVDQHRMAWSTSTNELLSDPSFGQGPGGESVTVEDLVCGCVAVPSRTLEVLFNYQTMKPEALVESAAELPFRSKFGATFHFSHHLVATAGYATAAAWGAEWGDLRSGYRTAMQEQLFAPMGMEATTVAFSEAEAIENRAAPHALDLEARYQPISSDLERFAEPIAPSGGVWSHVRDLSRYLMTQMARGRAPEGDRVVSPEQLTRTWEPGVDITDERTYGLGWANVDYNGKRVLSHTAQTMGFTSYLGFVPADDLGIVVLTNAAGAMHFAEAIRSRTLELAYVQNETTEWREVLAGYEAPDQYANIREAVADRVERDRLSGFLGRYDHPTIGVIDLRAKNGNAWLDVGEFDAELKLVRQSGSSPLLVGVEPPLVGVQIALGEGDDGGKTMRIRNGEETYDLERVEG